MKKIIFMIFGILLTSLGLAAAIPNPAPIYCENMGYTYNDTHCIFPDGKSCELWEFYNGDCGESYVVELSCVELGNSVEPGYECCEGLKPIGISSPGPNETCMMMEGSWSICLACGDEDCDETLENRCNCPEDCGITNVTQGNNAKDSGNNNNENSGDGENDGNGQSDDNGYGNVVTVNKTKVDKESITFSPWQKKNESECLEGCNCQGAVMSCETETGKIMTITAGMSGNIIVITLNNVQVETEMELEQERDQERNRTKLKAKMENGETREVKVMPDVASEKALERLRLKVCNAEEGCTIELKEVGKDSENDKNKELAYELQAERHAKLLGLFRTKMEVKAQVSAENGELIRIKKPWWAFLASEPEE